MVRKITILIISVLLIFFCLSGCILERREEISFAVGGAPKEIEFWEELVKRFESQHNVKINILRQPTDTDQRRQGLVIPLRAGQKDPDIFLMDVAWIAQFAASNWLETLSGYIEKYNMDMSIFFERVLNLADKYKGRLIALPVYVDGGLLYYRKDLLKKYGYAKPPETWQDLVTYARKIQEGERENNPNFYGFVWQAAQYEGLTCTFLEFAASGGGGIVKRDGELVLDIPANKEAILFMYDLIHRFKISPPNTFTEMKEEEVRNFFEHGYALFERNWPYAWALHQREGSLIKDKVGIAPLPHFPGGKSVSTLGGWHIGISKFSDNKEESFQFLRFILSYDIQKKLALTLGWNPGRQDIYMDKDVVHKLPHFTTLHDVFINAYPRPNLPYYTLISEVIQSFVNGVLSNKVNTEDALSSAQSEIRKIVNQYEKR